MKCFKNCSDLGHRHTSSFMILSKIVCSTVAVLNSELQSITFHSLSRESTHHKSRLKHVANFISDYSPSDYPRIPYPQYRSLNVHVTSYAGHSLLTAKTPGGIFVALGHAMRGASSISMFSYNTSYFDFSGWLSICQMGYLYARQTRKNTKVQCPEIRFDVFGLG